MTQNQIRYQEHLENVRNNREVLEETKRANQARESENYRHNSRTEDLGFANLDETRRHNYASENISYYTAGETARHNYATEGIQSYYNYAFLSENQRHNIATEKNQAEKNANDYAASMYATEKQSADRRYQVVMDNTTKENVAKIQQQTSAATNETQEKVAEINKQSRWETTAAGMFTNLLKKGGGALPSNFMQSIPLLY